MIGLRTQENDKFIKFFKLIQEEAKKINKIFFMDFGECKDIEFKDMELDELFGWLIPISESEKFNGKYINKNDLKEFNDKLVWCIPKIDNGKLNIEFRN